MDGDSTGLRGRIFVEFQGAAYRFGHSMVRPSYRANLAGDEGQAFFGMIFDPSQEGAVDHDLRGSCRAPRRLSAGKRSSISRWRSETQQLIDTRLSTPLFHLPLGAIPALGGPTALAQRNLLRHVTRQLPLWPEYRRGHERARPVQGRSERTQALDQGSTRRRRFGTMS